MRNFLILHAPKLKSKMRTVPKSGYTRRMKNYCPVWSLKKTMMTEWSPFRRNQGRPTLIWTFSTPQSFPMNFKVNPTPISLLRRKSRTPNYSQTAFNCSLRKTATMREMQSSSVLCDLIYCPRVWIPHPIKQFNYWAALDTLQLISFLLINWSRWPNVLPFYNSQWAINSAV